MSILRLGEHINFGLWFCCMSLFTDCGVFLGSLLVGVIKISFLGIRSLINNVLWRLVQKALPCRLRVNDFLYDTYVSSFVFYMRFFVGGFIFRLYEVGIGQFPWYVRGCYVVCITAFMSYNGD